MKKNILWLACAICLATGCKGGSQPRSEAQPAAPAADTLSPVSATPSSDYSFDQLFAIFSLFGDNVMTSQFAPQSVKDGIRDELKSMYDGYREFSSGTCNNLSYDLFNGDCYDGFQMGCWTYEADGHILVLLAENGGCDASATKYIRAYEFDPATGNTRETALPLNPAPSADDFNDIIRLAGCEDLPELHRMMRDRVYNYVFDPEGITILLNTFDNWEAAECGLQLYYRWNGSEFARDENAPYPCIGGGGFAAIHLGEPIPDLFLQPDPLGYGIQYSQGGDLWIVNLWENDVLQIQMEGGKVYSIEVFDPRYSIQGGFYWDGKGKLRVGSRIRDFFTFSEDDAGTLAWLFSDGTVSIETDNYNTHLAFRTTRDDLEGEIPEVSVDEVKVRLVQPRFKPEATVKSILLTEVDNG